MKNHKPYTITAKANDSIEILLYEMIGEDWFGEGTTAKSFAEDLKAAGKVSTIHLRVNSPGGNVFDGIAIYNTLLSHGAKVTAAVDGIAASIASVIVMAAEEISMNDNAMMMIHNPSTMIGGDAPRMRKMADTLDKIKSSMITAYRRHSTKSVEEIGALLDAETWMTAQETVDNGFAESVTTPEGEEADVAANFDLSHFRKVPVQIAAVFGQQPIAGRAKVKAPTRIKADGDMCDCPCAACMKDDCANCNDPDCDDPNCEDCPMQKEAEAKATTQAQEAAAQISRLQSQLASSEDRTKAARALSVELGAKVDTLERSLKAERQDHGKWMQRLSSELEQSASLYASSTSELTQRCQTAESIQSKLLPRIAAAEKLLADIKTERAAEILAISKWTERVSLDLQQSAKLYASVCEEVTRRSRLSASAADETRKRIEALVALLAQFKSERSDEVSAQAKWTERVSSDLQQSAKLHASVAEELSRRSHLAASAGDESRKRIESLEAAIVQFKEADVNDASVEAKSSERIAGELEQSAKLQDSVTEEIQRRSRQAGINGEFGAHVQAADTLFAELKAALVAEPAAPERLQATTDLKRAGEIYGAAIGEIARRSRLSALTT